MSDARVFLGGEGPDELGDWFHHPSYRTGQRGVIEALLRRVKADGWQVGGAVAWKAIRKFRAGDHQRPEQRNVLGLAQMAREAGCTLVAFTRDRDGDPARAQEVEAALSEVGRRIPELRVIGGVATEMIEGWVLALHGQRGSEGARQAKEHLAAALGIRTLADVLAVIDGADLRLVPADAASLRAWLARAASALGSTARP